MEPEEILELLELKDWKRIKLAAECDVTENTVHQWISGRRKAGGPAAILMRQWLNEARAEKPGKRREKATA